MSLLYCTLLGKLFTKSEVYYETDILEGPSTASRKLKEYQSSFNL